MIIRLLQSLSGKTAFLAMLCKTTVARKVIRYSWQQKIQLEQAVMYLIDNNKYFSVNVEACLLVCRLKPNMHSCECAVFSSIFANNHQTKFALTNGDIITNLNTAPTYDHLSSQEKKPSGVPE